MIYLIYTTCNIIVFIGDFLSNILYSFSILFQNSIGNYFKKLKNLPIQF